MVSAATSYDEIPYPTYARTWTHPDRLAVIATLMGMKPANPAQARVLELGCADGANLMGIAFHYPEARIVGIDLAALPLERGRTLANRLGLRNLELLHRDLLEFRPEGEFDYIIAHGLYSWVPAAVRARLLEICRDHLSGQGVAFVSYNALPGAYFHMLVRDLMRFHTREIDAPEQKLAAAAEIAAWIAEASRDDEVGRVIRREVGRLSEREATFIYHDDLAPVSEPIYLQDFIAAAASHRLQYVADADSVLGATLNGDGRKVEKFAAGDLARGEQYLDFVHARRFRQSILCHQGVSLDRSLARLPLGDLHVACSMPSGPEQPDGTQEFRLRADCTVSTNQPFAKHLLTTLTAVWPSTLPLREFDGWAEQCDTVLRLFAGDAVRLRMTPVRAPRHAGPRPVASALARAEVELGRLYATSPYHFMIDMRDPLLRELMPLLDGTRDREALTAELAAAVRAGMGDSGQTQQGGQLVDLPAGIDKALDALGMTGLLV